VRVRGPIVPGTGLSSILSAVEQRIGPNIQPVHAVGTDPAYVPLLTPGPDDAGHELEDVLPEEVPDGATLEEAPDGAPPEEAAASQEEKADGPTFEAIDRRGSITVDHSGIRFRLDDQEAEFHWDEIGAVEVKTSRYGRRLTVTVHTPGQRWYPAEVEAPARSRLKEWTAELDAALDAYFEET
jgi:hypothetical protein